MTIATAKSVVRLLNLLQEQREARQGDVEDTVVDEFVCAFLAEPTRWAEEQVFNQLALRGHGGQAELPLTGSQAPSALPMASGTTWEPQLMRLGGETPSRIVGFARAIGLDLIIDAEKNAGDLNAFLAGMKRQYSLIPDL